MHLPQISELEKVVGVALPPEYRSWLEAGELSVPDPNFYWVIKGDWGSGIEQFYGFKEPYDLRSYATDRHEYKVPSDLMLIGDDGMAGTYLAIGLAGKRLGQVYFLDTCHTAFGQITSDADVHAIGRSFTKWITSLCDDPDE